MINHNIIKLKSQKMLLPSHSTKKRPQWENNFLQGKPPHLFYKLLIYQQQREKCPNFDTVNIIRLGVGVNFLSSFPCSR